MSEAGKSEPLKAFPWRGFYGGAARRILVEYDDRSSTSIGIDDCVTLQNAHVDLLTAFDTLLAASIADYGLSDDDGDDEAVAMSRDGGVHVKFGMLRKARAALASARGEVPPQERAAQEIQPQE